MKKESIKVELNYSIGEHPTMENTIVISITGTGIDLKCAKHKSFIEAITRVVGSEMFAHANNVKQINISYE